MDEKKKETHGDADRNGKHDVQIPRFGWDSHISVKYARNGRVLRFKEQGEYPSAVVYEEPEQGPEPRPQKATEKEIEMLCDIAEFLGIYKVKIEAMNEQ